MLAVLVRQPRQTAPPVNPRPTAVNQPDPEGVRQQLLTNTQAQNELRQRDPELAATINDANRWRETFTMRQRQAGDAERERQNQIALLNEDPFNVEAL
jgi:DNA damage-inducible protein 1